MPYNQIITMCIAGWAVSAYKNELYFASGVLALGATVGVLTDLIDYAIREYKREERR